jgi:hypothetical protein
MMAGDDEASEKQQSALAARAARAAASLPSFDRFERDAANEAAKEAAAAKSLRGGGESSGDRRAWVPAVSPQGTAFTSRARSYGDQSEEEARARDPLGAFPSTVTTTLTSKGGVFWFHDDDDDGGDGGDREPRPEAATPPPRRRRLKKPTPAADALASLAPILRDSEIRLAAVRARAKEYLGLEVREAFGEGDHALHGW